jgi:hypothetical protein
VPKANIASLNWPHCLCDYSFKDVKSCNAIHAKRFSALPIRQSSERRVQSVGLEWDFYGTVFGHTASYTNRLTRFQIFHLTAMICIKKFVIQKSQNRPYATPNPE